MATNEHTTTEHPPHPETRSTDLPHQMAMCICLYDYQRPFPPRGTNTGLSQPPAASTMASASQRPKRPHSVLSTLDVAIQTLNLAKDACGVLPAQAVFSGVSALLTMIRVRFRRLFHGRHTHAYCRTVRQMIRITSTSDCLALMFARPSSGV